MEFSDALKKAQELGYAEADPTADVEGLDAGRKMAIMAFIAFKSRVCGCVYGRNYKNYGGRYRLCQRV